MDPTANTAALVARHLADPSSGWAIGTFGAIAEFARDVHEPAQVEAGAVVTARGAIAVHAHPATRIVAWERPVANGGWTQGLAFCLRAGESVLAARETVTEFGPDRDALRPQDRDALRFDLGIGAPHCDLCVRTRDAALIGRLRAAAGTSMFAAGPALLAALAAASPHRVCVSRLGRVEVFAPIPPADGATPEGPHTHVLPALLRYRRTHPATVPLPEGWVPCLELYPPAAIEGGRFQPARHGAFQVLLDAYGPPAAMAAKRDVLARVRAGEPPTEGAVLTRAQRIARRVALRQLAHTDGPSAALDAWRAAFDSGGTREH